MILERLQYKHWISRGATFVFYNGIKALKNLMFHIVFLQNGEKQLFFYADMPDECFKNWLKYIQPY